MNTNHLISTYGYWAVFVFVAAESLGVPIPGETALILAGAYAGQTHRLSPWLIFAVAAAAAIIGNIAGYSIGFKGGYALAKRYGRKVHLDERKLKVGRYVLDRQGGKVIFFGRFISILRTYIAFLAGTVRMDWRKFGVATAAAALVWAGGYTAAAYQAAKTLKRLSGTIDLVFAGVAVVIIVAVILFTRNQMRVLGDKAEAAYPGPIT
ncbi:MAG TPA: DedA family protein [Acidimicrobiales bacterium]|nr:DedA family protein [Acidimicrobiales bacterium]